MTTPFTQSPPRLGNQYRNDAFLHGYLRRKLPADMLREIDGDLDAQGEVAREMYELQLLDRCNEPTLTQWDAWGHRIDRIEVTPLWRRAADVAARSGLIAIPYERRHGRHSRIHQFASVYLFHPSSDVYTCPLAMTDGAARTLIASGNRALIERAVPHLISRDPRQAWTSGQWMTEATGGSDVGSSLTEAVMDERGQWRLYGKKWFTSAVTSQMALTLARPRGNGPGGGGLAMFYVEVRNDEGRPNGIRVERLKDKLGTRKVPTAELLLDGTHAHLVSESHNGTRNIEPMLVVTRAWNAVTSAAFMRRGVALARSYAAERKAFGAKLEAQPLHADTLAGLEAETRAAFLIAFELVELMGYQESSELDDERRALMRLLTPIAKLITAKQAVSVLGECIEAFGGAGYVEDTGLPLLLRDAQVLPIWEGTTNVLALDAVLRGNADAGLAAMNRRIASVAASARHPELARLAVDASRAIAHVSEWLRGNGDPARLQAGARRFAMTVGRALGLALLVEHAQWQIDAESDLGGVAAARRFASSPIDMLIDLDPEDAAALL